MNRTCGIKFDNSICPYERGHPYVDYSRRIEDTTVWQCSCTENYCNGSALVTGSIYSLFLAMCSGKFEGRKQMSQFR